MTGQALAMKMRLELAQIAKRHRVEPQLSCALPLAPPSSRALMIAGIAATDTIDQERMRFTPGGLMFLPWQLPPLLHRHHEPAGEIIRLEHDPATGRLLINARVDHDEAKRCGGFSVAATILKYELRDVDDPKNFHALITRADLDEVSLTPTPANAACIVTSRFPAFGHEFNQLATKSIGLLMQQVEILRQQIRDQPTPQPTPKHPRERPPAAPPKATPFRDLVQAMEARAQ